MEKKAMDFLAMDFSAQESIINACLVNSAKLINSLQKESTNYGDYKSYRDCVVFLFANHDEIFNDSWINCVEMASDEKYSDIPLALFVSKASGKALRKAFYWNAKSASEKADTETMVNCANCFDDYSIVFDIDRIESILSFVRDDIKANCKRTIDMLICGYNYTEIAKVLCVSVNTVCKYASAIANACAMVNCADGEFSKLESMIERDIMYKDIKARQALESAIYKAYESFYKCKPKSLAQAIERLKNDCYMKYDSKALASAFYGK